MCGDEMNRTEAEKVTDFMLNEMLSFADKPEGARGKVIEWLEANISIESADEIIEKWKMIIHGRSNRT